VVLEALSFALPVITLDLAGTALFVNEECGTVVNTHNKSEGEIEIALGTAIVELATRPEMLTQKSEGALRRAEQLLLERQFARVMEVIKAALESKSGSNCTSDIENVR
jgi:glycosyltransferase involved in cell wall biosynthesis